MIQPTSLGHVVAAWLLAVPLVTGLTAQTPPQAVSVAKVAEFAALLAAKKLEAYAVKDPRSATTPDKPRYIAALLVPNSQLLLVAATHTHFMDMEYYLHNKEYQNAYTNLSSSTLSEDKLFFEDALHDGLVALPGKSLVSDAVRIGSARQDFNGVFLDPRRKNPAAKLTQEDYFKAFVSADERYAKILDVLIAELKKPAPPLAPPAPLR